MNKTSQNENYNWIKASLPIIKSKFITLLNEVFRNYSFPSQNECSFVSLRDVERAMKVIIWFHSNSELINLVIGDEDNESSEESSEDESDENNDDVEQVEQVSFLRFFLLLHKILLIKHTVSKENDLEPFFVLIRAKAGL